jgi:hypothetical protein
MHEGVLSVAEKGRGARGHLVAEVPVSLGIGAEREIDRMTWHIFLLIPFVLYIGVIVAAFFNEGWSASLMGLYFGSLGVIMLVCVGLFMVMVVISDPVGMTIIAGGSVATVVIVSVLGVIKRMRWKR